MNYIQTYYFFICYSRSQFFYPFQMYNLFGCVNLEDIFVRFLNYMDLVYHYLLDLFFDIVDLIFLFDIFAR